jgi:glucose-6-phosphate isomerase
VLQAILEGTKKAYQEQGMPFMEVVLDDISEHSLGEFMQFKMYEVIYLAQLYDVNAFDQPSVETYKKTTRQLLEKK